MYQIGIDVGGTFTDFVLHNDETGDISIHKMPSTPTDPSRAAIAGIEALSARDGFDPAQLNRVLHGTTIATNIILQRNGARVGMITTEGFRDILHIGRKNRPLNFSNYQDVPRQTAPLVPRRLRLTVPERVRAPPMAPSKSRWTRRRRGGRSAGSPTKGSRPLQSPSCSPSSIPITRTGFAIWRRKNARTYSSPAATTFRRSTANMSGFRRRP